jgi:hypothetical protein
MLIWQLGPVSQMDHAEVHEEPLFFSHFFVLALEKS